MAGARSQTCEHFQSVAGNVLVALGEEVRDKVSFSIEKEERQLAGRIPLRGHACLRRGFDRLPPGGS